jgi:Peptidase M50B-like
MREYSDEDELDPSEALEPHEGEDAEESGQAPELVGGFAFFLSLLALLPTGILFASATLYRVRAADYTCTTRFCVAVLIGAALGQIFIRGHLSVLIHEFKHSLISNLVGNRHRGLKIGRHSGHYTYAYSKRTAHYNAFISLAPYITPVFTFVAVLVSLIFLREDRQFAAAVVGFGYGVDLILNMRDISPIQTDISLIKGGYGVGLLYIAAWNLLTFAMLLAWVFQGTHGLLLLLEDISACFVYLYISLFGDPRG